MPTDGDRHFMQVEMAKPVPFFVLFFSLCKVILRSAVIPLCPELHVCLVVELQAMNLWVL
jgi:hypothetical protein